MTGAARLESDRGLGDFKRIKQSVSIVQVLEHYELMKTLERRGDSLSGPCPLHGGHHEKQFKTSVSKNCWNCFGKCKAGGNILDFVSRKEGVGIREAGVLISEWFGLSQEPVKDRPETKPETQKPSKAAQEAGDPAPDATRNKPLGFALKYLEQDHSYLAERGLSAETIQTFGIGFCKKGLMAGRIAIPIHNMHGAIVAYVGRWPGNPPEGKEKYKQPDGFKRTLEVFNVHRAATVIPEQPLLVVPGIFDCMKVWQAGHHPRHLISPLVSV